MAKTTKKETTLTSIQICNELKFTGLNRQYVYKRYMDKVLTKEEWEAIFKKDGLVL